MFENIEINLDENARRYLIKEFEQMLKHGDGPPAIGDILAGLMECDRITIYT